jgi:hypothetical protein
MFRIAIVSGITLFSVVAATAGQIQIGSGVNGGNGLTSSAVSGCCTEQGYVPVMFEGASVTPPTGPGNLTDNLGDGGSGVTFSLINDGAGKNFWDIPTGTGGATLTIPIGIYGVTDVWTMLNDLEGTNGRDVNVMFNFGTSANTTLDTVTVKPTNANGAGNGQVRNGLVCISGCVESTQPGFTAGTSVGVSMVGDNIWQQSFGCVTVPSSLGGQASTPCGTAYLDDQGFFFNSLALGGGLTNLNTYLVSVQIKEISTVGNGAGLSAVTVDAIPEPSTVLLFAAGLAVLGLGRLRKRA